MYILKIFIGIILIFNISLAKEKPLFVDITVLGAIIGPTKVTGKNWDTSFSLNKNVGSLISEMVVPGSGILASTAISIIGKDAPKGKSAPDVIGYIKQIGPTTKDIGQKAFTPLILATKRFNFTKDSYIPSFDTGYSGWPVYEDTRFRIKLWDRDLRDNDNIGTVEINIDDIRNAIQAKKPIWINVSEQSQNQILFISISSMRSNKNAKPYIRGYKW